MNENLCKSCVNTSNSNLNLNISAGSRIKIGIFGRANVGKSSIMNMLCAQNISIVSPISGSTSDGIHKAFEIDGIGAVSLIDTAGICDEICQSDPNFNTLTSVENELLRQKNSASFEILDDVSVAILVITAKTYGAPEQTILSKIGKKPLLILVNKVDEAPLNKDVLTHIKAHKFIEISAKTGQGRDEIFRALKLITPKNRPRILADIVRQNELILLVTPLDDESPADRLILPQSQTIKEILDIGADAIITRFSDVGAICKKFNPDLIICDSSCVTEVIKTAPKNVKITTFSILFSRAKGDFNEFLRGAQMIKNLHDNDKILIAEACSHNAKDGDIARVKIPNLLRKIGGDGLEFAFTNGKDFPPNLAEFALVVHCGGCMINAQTMQNRIAKVKNAGICVTNYGLAISFCQGVLGRVVEIFE